MVRTVVIAVAVVTFVAGIQVSEGRVLTSERQSSATQQSTTTGEEQDGRSGAQDPEGGTQTSEPQSSATQESNTREEQEGTSGAGDLLTPPGMNDPDCDVTDGTNHTYSLCTFACGDQVASLYSGEKCTLPGTSAAPLPSGSPLARAIMDTGICQGGKCIKQEQDNITFPDTVQEQGSTAEGVPTANVVTENVTAENISTENVPTEYTPNESTPNESTPNESTPNESTANENVTTENVTTEDVSTKNLTTENGTNEYAPTTTNAPTGNAPTENDPDCRGARDRNHVYFGCTYTCEGDEVFVASDNTRCYLTGTSAAPRPAESLLAHAITGTGLCKDGECVKQEQDTVQEHGSTAEGVPTGSVPTGSVPTGSVPTGNVITEDITTEDVTTEDVTTENVTTENVTTENVTTENITAENTPNENLTTKYVPTENFTNGTVSTENFTTENGTTGNLPTENDPDCGGSRDENHVYFGCTYTCEGDEVFVARDNTRCYISNANDTLASINVTEEPNKNQGRCKDGVCVNITKPE